MKLLANHFTRLISGQASCAFITHILLVSLCVAWFAGCSKSGSTGKTATGTTTPALIIDSLPFGEMNGKDEYNASGVVALADSRFLICDNNTSDALFELNLTPDGKKNGTLIRRPLVGVTPDAVDDLEDMTLVEEGGKRYVFVTSSLYVKKAKKEKPNIPPSGVLRVTVNSDNSLKAENITGFREWLISAHPQLAVSAQSEPDDGGLNIEGFTWDKSRHAFLFGIRTPVPDSRPLILPVKVKDLAGPWTTSNLEAQPAIQLMVGSTLGEQGIRGLFADPDRGTFLVITGKAGSDSKAPFALYEWNGDAEGLLKRFDVAFAKKMKPEGLTRGTIGGKKALVVVDDAGGFQVIWTDQQLPFVGGA